MNWSETLRKLSDAMVAQMDHWDRDTLREGHHDPNYLGYPPATEDEIAAAEARLKLRLPSAFRAFLMASDGWRYAMGFPVGIASILGATEIFWMRDDRMRNKGRFRDHVRNDPQRFGPKPDFIAGDDPLDRLLCIGDCDGNECVLYVASASPDDWPVIVWHHEMGFSDHDSFTELMTDELAYWAKKSVGS